MQKNLTNDKTMTKVLIKNIQRKKAFTVSCLLLVIVLLNRSSLAESSLLLIHETHDETFQKGLPNFVELQNKKQLLTKSGLMMKTAKVFPPLKN